MAVGTKVRFSPKRTFATKLPFGGGLRTGGPRARWVLHQGSEPRKKAPYKKQETRMTAKTKLRTKLEALTKGKSVRVSAISSSTSPEYRRAVYTIGNIRVGSGRQFSMKLGTRALTITRTK